MLPELYHAHHLHYSDDLPFWLGLAARTGAPILELGCGTGRVLVPLAQAGYRVIGLDHDLGMLHFLLAHADLHLKQRLSAVAADIGCFALAERFPLIILPCNTYSTLSTAQRRGCLECVRRQLKPQGLFVVNVPNPQLLERLPAESGPEYEDEFAHPHTGNPVQVSTAWKRSRGAFTVTWMYDQLFPDGKVERLSVETTHNKISVTDHREEFHTAGLEVTHLYGDFDHSAYSHDSPSLILVATSSSH